MTKHSFGGQWTNKKLQRVEKYLKAYTTIMNKQSFRFAYIDAFAGTGYREAVKDMPDDQLSLFDKGDLHEINRYSAGSARIALQVEPSFDRYIFVEKSEHHCAELLKLQDEFSEKKKRVQIVHADANQYILDLCLNHKWTNHRAVMFLDPYGMQVQWETVEAIAQTKAVDLWYLFPLGIGLNRMLTKEADKIPASWREKIDGLLGTSEWLSAFYQEKKDTTLFEVKKKLLKDADFQRLGSFIVQRLRTIFAGVADNPLRLYNSKNNPLYLLCFAAGNLQGAKTAVKIAHDILGRP